MSAQSDQLSEPRTDEERSGNAAKNAGCNPGTSLSWDTISTSSIWSIVRLMLANFLSFNWWHETISRVSLWVSVTYSHFVPMYRKLMIISLQMRFIYILCTNPSFPYKSVVLTRFDAASLWTLSSHCAVFSSPISQFLICTSVSHHLPNRQLNRDTGTS